MKIRIFYEDTYIYIVVPPIRSAYPSNVIFQRLTIFGDGQLQSAKTLPLYVVLAKCGRQGMVVGE